MCLIGSVLEGGHKFANFGLSMGVAIGGAAAKSGKNTNLLVIVVRVRLLDESDSIQKRKRLETIYVRKVFATTAEFVS